MSHLRDDFIHGSIFRLQNRFKGRPQFTPQIGGNADRVPVQFGVALAESATLPIGNLRSGKPLPFLGQELVTRHPCELVFCFVPRLSPFPIRVGGVFVVPIMVPEFDDEISLPQLLTSDKTLIEMNHPLSLRRDWPPVTIGARRGYPCCSPIAWLYLSRPFGTFHAEPPPFSGCARHRCFIPRKVLLVEVVHGHGS